MLGILGGSGLYNMPGLEDVHERQIATPFGEPSDAVVEASLEGSRVVFLARHGRTHRLAAHEINYRANVFALKIAGATQLLSVSAVGSLREDYRPGDAVVIDQYIDRTQGRSRTFFEGLGVVVHAGFADPLDAALRASLLRAARRAVDEKGASVRVHDGGAYLCIDGPQFSTRAESRLHRGWGVDVVGMTNLPEARLAREAELPYASLCLVTDYDAWHPTEGPVEVAGVIAQLERNAVFARAVIRNVARDLPDATRSPAATALDDALLTPASAIDDNARARVGLLLARVLQRRSA